MKPVTLLLLFGLATGALAQSTARVLTVSEIADRLGDLYDVGVTSGRTYNFDDLAQLKACVQKHQPLRAEAQRLRQETLKLPMTNNRVDLFRAADEVFPCLACAGARESCRTAAALLYDVHRRLAAEKRRAPR